MCVCFFRRSVQPCRLVWVCLKQNTDPFGGYLVLHLAHSLHFSQSNLEISCRVWPSPFRGIKHKVCFSFASPGHEAGGQRLQHTGQTELEVLVQKYTFPPSALNVAILPESKPPQLVANHPSNKEKNLCSPSAPVSQDNTCQSLGMGIMGTIPLP